MLRAIMLRQIAFVIETSQARTDVDTLRFSL